MAGTDDIAITADMIASPACTDLSCDLFLSSAQDGRQSDEDENHNPVNPNKPSASQKDCVVDSTVFFRRSTSSPSSYFELVEM